MIDWEKEFALRLSQLRIQKEVSAREMSLSIGQNESYINRIENGLALPSMQAFFYICDYLKVSPAEFFNDEMPVTSLELAKAAGELTEKQNKIIMSVVKEFTRKSVR